MEGSILSVAIGYGFALFACFPWLLYHGPGDNHFILAGPCGLVFGLMLVGVCWLRLMEGTRTGQLEWSGRASARKSLAIGVVSFVGTLAIYWWGGQVYDRTFTGDSLEFAVAYLLAPPIFLLATALLGSRLLP